MTAVGSSSPGGVPVSAGVHGSVKSGDPSKCSYGLIKAMMSGTGLTSTVLTSRPGSCGGVLTVYESSTMSPAPTIVLAVVYTTAKGVTVADDLMKLLLLLLEWLDDVGRGLL